MPSDTPPSSAVAIFGATSDIAIAVARRYAETGSSLVLIGRDDTALSGVAADLTARGARQVEVQQADFTQTAGLPALVETIWKRFGRLDIALITYGTLPDQVAAEQQAAAAEAALLINFTSPVILINELARHFEGSARMGKPGTIAVITSVAGDRGRKSNHVYGAAKGGLQRYLEGLRHRLYAAGITVLDIRPGFVITKMTAHLDRKGPLWAPADKVAADIVKAIGSRRAVLYTPWFWRGVMTAIRNVPRPIFHRTSL